MKKQRIMEIVLIFLFVLLLFVLSNVTAITKTEYINSPIAPFYLTFNDSGVVLINYSLTFQSVLLNILIQENQTVQGTEFTVFAQDPFQETTISNPYAFVFTAVDSQSYPMEEPFHFLFVPDFTPPTILSIFPVNGSIVDTGLPSVTILFNENVTLEVISTHPDDEGTDYGSGFNTNDNQLFISNFFFEAGVRSFIIKGTDIAGNSVEKEYEIVIHTEPNVITLLEPKYKAISADVFTLSVATAYHSSCRYEKVNSSFAEPPLYVSMVQMSTIDQKRHDGNSILFTGVINNGGGIEYYYVLCNDSFGEFANQTYRIEYNSTVPIITSFVASPTLITDYTHDTLKTEVSLDTDIQTLCKYDYSNLLIDDMRYYFDGDDPTTTETFKTRHTKTFDNLTDNTNYTVFARCYTKAFAPSPSASVQFNVNTRIGNEIIVKKPKQYETGSPLYFDIETTRLTKCKYKIDNGNYSEQGFWTLSKTHQSNSLTLPDGNHNVLFVCTFYNLSSNPITEIENVSKTVNFNIDSQNPLIQSVTLSDPDINSTTHTYKKDRLYVEFHGNDTGSGIYGYNYTVENKTGGTIKDWAYTAQEIYTITDLDLDDLTSYLVKAKAIDNSGRQSEDKTSNSIIVDTSLKPIDNTTNPGDNSSDPTDICSNNEEDIEETDVDCGGLCLPCDIGQKCKVGRDCVTGYCDDDFTCQPDACSNNILDGFETDVDCGGECNPCDDNKKCMIASDCWSGVCKTGECISIEDLCSNLELDDQETDTDCGGLCSSCLEGKKCKIHQDCTTGNCQGSICSKKIVDTDNDGVQDAEDLCPGTPAGCTVDTTGCQVDPECGKTVEDKKSILPWLLLILALLLMAGSGAYYYYFYIKKKEKPNVPFKPSTGSSINGLQTNKPGLNIDQQKEDLKDIQDKIKQREAKLHLDKEKKWHSVFDKFDEEKEELPKLPLKKPQESTNVNNIIKSNQTKSLSQVGKSQVGKSKKLVSDKSVKSDEQQIDDFLDLNELKNLNKPITKKKKTDIDKIKKLGSAIEKLKDKK